MSHSTQKIKIYFGKPYLRYPKLEKTKKKRIFEKRFFLVFRAWEGQLTLDKDESYRYCTPATPLQNEILVDALGFEMKKCEHKL
jgi:hypothetical protein